MEHNEEVKGVSESERSFFKYENLITTLCGHLFKLSEFVKVESEE